MEIHHQRVAPEITGAYFMQSHNTRNIPYDAFQGFQVFQGHAFIHELCQGIFADCIGGAENEEGYQGGSEGIEKDPGRIDHSAPYRENYGKGTQGIRAVMPGVGGKGHGAGFFTPE